MAASGSGDLDRARPMTRGLFLDVLAFADRMGLDPIVAFGDGSRAERIPDGIESFPFVRAESATSMTSRPSQTTARCASSSPPAWTATSRS
jgi:hypothetical protein